MPASENQYHALLKRQLRRFPGLQAAAADHPDWLQAIDAVYREFDADRRMLERSLELTSEELMGRNAQLQQDNTHRREIESRLAHSLSLLNATLNATADGILVTDLEGKVITCSGRFLEMWRIPAELVQGRSVDWLVQFLKNKISDPAGFLERLETIYGDPHMVSVDVLRLTDGRVFKRLCEPQIMDGVVVGRVASFQDITEEIRGQEELLRLAFHDDLTGLPNRPNFMSKLETALCADSPDSVAVLFMDVDRFKVINDGLGHEAGDRLLQEIAGRLKSSVPDTAMVARFGGDEFVAFLRVQRPAEATLVAERILESLRHAIQVSKHESYSTVSIGVAIGQTGAISAEALVRNADTAMYHAKRKGRARHEVFTASMYERAVSLIQLETDLRRACATMSQFELLYQPIVSGRVLVGMEALIRWRTPEGLLTPDRFLDLAEDTGLMVGIGAWVIGEACRVLADLRREGAELFVAVNLSVSQLAGTGLREVVEAALNRFGLPAESLHLELTETQLMEQAGEGTATLAGLRELGIPISMDDFGTGYSSLSYLSRLPLDTLKVDRSFVRNLPENKEMVAITRAILALAQALGLSVVAEGVETESQAAFLMASGCPLQQGYLHGRPISAEAVRELLPRTPASRPLRAHLA